MSVNSKKVLGKGLDALLGETKDVDSGIQEIEVSKIVPNPEQPRDKFVNITELADSIKSKGVIQPIIVSKQDKGYEIIAGERRWRAAKLAGMKTIPAIIRDVDADEKLEITLIENIQRENLDPVEEAKAYKMLIDKFNLSQEQLAKRVGKQRSTIANSLRLLNLPNKILDDLKNGRLQPGHVRPLINIKNLNLVLEMRDKIIKEGLSVREAEQLISRYKIGHKKEDKTKLKSKPPEILEFEDRIEKKIGTKVRINGNTNSGKIVIEYYSSDDFDRITEYLLQ